MCLVRPAKQSGSCNGQDHLEMQDSSCSHNLYLSVDSFKGLILCKTARRADSAGWLITPTGTTSPVRAVPQGLPARSSGFRLPVVISDTLWKNHQQYMESHPGPGCQLSVPGGGANLSIGMPGSSFVSIKPSSDVSVLLLFLRKLHSRPSCTLSRGHSGSPQQQKASVLPVWSSSAGETLVETSPCLLGAFALAPLARTGLSGLRSGQKAMLQPQKS